MIDASTLADEIVKKLKEDHHAVWLDPETHALQHEFIVILMEEHEERRQAKIEKDKRRKAIEDKVAGSLVLSLILTLVGLIGAGSLDWLRSHLK